MPKEATVNVFVSQSKFTDYPCPFCGSTAFDISTEPNEPDVVACLNDGCPINGIEFGIEQWETRMAYICPDCHNDKWVSTSERLPEKPDRVQILSKHIKSPWFRGAPIAIEYYSGTEANAEHFRRDISFWKNLPSVPEGATWTQEKL